jgi:uncharacterized protein (DUF433 family)
MTHADFRPVGTPFLKRAQSMGSRIVGDKRITTLALSLATVSFTDRFYWHAILLVIFHRISIGGCIVAFLDERITVDPEQCGGRPCIRGMRIRVSDVLDLLAGGLTPKEVIEELPDLEEADIQACLRFASRRLGHPVLVT